MNTKYLVVLNEAQRQHLEKLTLSGKVPARQMKQAPILLKSDVQSNWPYERIMEAFDVSAVTIAAVRRAFVEVTEKRRKVEWASVMKQVADRLYPQAEKIMVILDNLNTHTPSAFYEMSLRKLDVPWNALSSTLLPSMAASSTWLRLN